MCLNSAIPRKSGSSETKIDLKSCIQIFLLRLTSNHFKTKVDVLDLELTLKKIKTYKKHFKNAFIFEKRLRLISYKKSPNVNLGTFYLKISLITLIFHFYNFVTFNNITNFNIIKFFNIKTTLITLTNPLTSSLNRFSDPNAPV